MFVEPALAIFPEPTTNTLHAYSIDLLIAPAAPDHSKISSLLGRNILDRWRMLYDPTNDALD